MDPVSLEAGSIVTLVVCGLIVLAAVVRFIIHILSDRKDK
jgi:hypothetical protein